MIGIENHPNDSRVNLDESGTVQTLTGRMGTGGGNVPMVMEQKTFSKERRAQSKDDFETWRKGGVANTLNTFDRGDVRATDLVVEKHDPVYCLQGNGIDRAETAGCNGKGYREDASYTLNTIDRPAVAYGIDRVAFNQGINAQYAPQFDKEKSATIVVRGPNAVCYATGNGQADNSTVSDTFGALDCMHDQKIAIIGHEEGAKTYIVRRLTPIECARLQGFPDWWGQIDYKEDFTEEEYAFWLNVRNTMAQINGKAVKEYTKDQMLKWYNKLHTDSAEYKMWGNGVALPCVLYVMQGIAEGDE